MILWGKDHKDRATALAAAYGESALDVASLPRGSDGIAAVACGDATLTVWGHGDAESFAEMSNGEFGQLIKNWKKRNPSLKTVEIVTCDARHNSDPFSGYAVNVAKFVEDNCPGVAVKALPIGQSRDDASILWANATTASFCYITAPSEATLTNANQLLLATEAGLGYDLNQVAQKMALKRGSAPNDYTVTGGYFRNLRDYLGTI